MPSLCTYCVQPWRSYLDGATVPRCVLQLLTEVPAACGWGLPSGPLSSHTSISLQTPHTSLGSNLGGNAVTLQG